MNKEFIFIISHSNYKNWTGGTEKLIAGLEKVYLSKGISFVQIFPYPHSKHYIGLNINGKFKGVYRIYNLSNIISDFCKKGYKCKGIIIQHLKNYDLISLADQLKKMNIEINIEIHDFYLICNTFNFLKNKKHFCGITQPCDKKCNDCYNYKNYKKFKTERDYFFNILDSLIVRIIFPSEYCKNKWLSFFNKYEPVSVVRPNLTYSGIYKKKEKNKRMRVAYIGKKNIYKGVETWNKIINDKKITNNIDLYYFGINIENNSKVKEILTNKDMEQNLRNYNIDIVVLWSIIPETFSYTYYEASSSGAIILTNEASGNIYKMVKKNQNGIIFKTEKELIDFLENKELKRDIEKNTKAFSPNILEENLSIEEFKYNKENFSYYKKSKAKKNIFLYYLYLFVKGSKL